MTELLLTSTRGPTRRTALPPVWTTVAAYVGVALFVAMAATRRGRICMRMRPRLSRSSAHGDTYLEAFTLKVLLVAVLVLTIQFVDWESVSRLVALSRLGEYRVLELVALGYMLARARSVRAPLAEIGFRRGRGVLRELAIGLVAGILMWLTCVPAKSLLRSGASDGLFSTTASIVLDIVVLTPLFEEVFYRGVLYRHLRDGMPWLRAVVVSAAVFALLHDVGRMPTAFVIGLACALLREWRGSLLAPVAAHASWNLLTMAPAVSRLVSPLS